MNTTTLKTWLTQPTTIQGLGLIVGAAAAALAHFAGGNTSVAAICGVVAAALPHLGINDNTASVKPIETFFEDAATAFINKQLTERMPSLVTEGVAAFKALTSETETTSTPTTGTTT